MTDNHRLPHRAVGCRRTAIALRQRRATAAAVIVAACVCGAAGAGCGQDRGGAPPAVAGSASGSATHAAAPLADACELLTAEDVQTVTREVSGSLSSTLEDAIGKDPSQCSYSLGGVPPRLISLSLRRFPGAAEAASQQQIAESGLRSIAGGAAVQDLPHLGDGAFWVGGQIDQLNVRRGDALLVFTVQLDKDPLGAGRSLAARVLARLASPAPTPRPAPTPGAAGAAAAGSPQPQGGGPS